MEILAESTAISVINVPAEKINLTEWLFTLKEEEYQACSPAHIACGTSISKDGKRLSINVELVGDSLLVQHYMEEIGEKDHCLVYSLADSISSAGNARLGVTWELKVKKLSGTFCELSNHVVVSLTPEFSALLTKANITDLTPIKNSMQQNLEMHNKEETPLFANDMEAKALAGIWTD
ncbi:MAG: hypothetical protein H7Y86_01810 [Rhizobacter sp.]|nr:hypothetical protein [Ferruginibacter sp.]